AGAHAHAERAERAAEQIACWQIGQKAFCREALPTALDLIADRRDHPLALLPRGWSCQRRLVCEEGKRHRLLLGEASQRREGCSYDPARLCRRDCPRCLVDQLSGELSLRGAKAIFLALEQLIELCAGNP